MAAPSGTSLSLGLLILRLGAGAMLFLGHGLPKLMSFEQRSKTFLDPFGLGSPVSLGLAVFAEVVCSALVAIGFVTRLAAIPPIILLLVAIVVAHAGDPLGRRELAIMHLLCFVTIALAGPGRFALDARFGPRVSFKGS